MSTALKTSKITTLDLGGNHLHKFTTEQWTVFSAIFKDSKIETFHASKNHLNDLTPEQWAFFGAALNDSCITSLNLYYNHLGKLTPEQWTIFFAALKDSSVTTLDLHGNDLESLTLEHWISIGESLCKTKITSLILSVNHLRDLTSEEWSAFSSIFLGSAISHLDLNDNNLSYIAAEQWCTLGKGLQHSKISSLDLSLNELYRLTPEQWAAIGCLLRDSKITTLNLRKNGLNRLSQEQNFALIQAVRTSCLETIIFDDTTTPFSTQSLHEISAILLMNRVRRNLVSDEHPEVALETMSVISLPAEQFSTFIATLSALHTPLSHLVAGLLLTEHISTDFQWVKSPPFAEDERTKEFLSNVIVGLPLLQKGREDDILKPAVDFIILGLQARCIKEPYVNMTADNIQLCDQIQEAIVALFQANPIQISKYVPTINSEWYNFRYHNKIE